jgi:hypothetical protein
MQISMSLKHVFEQGIASFPYPIIPTGVKKGSLTPTGDGDYFMQEFMFDLTGSPVIPAKTYKGWFETGVEVGEKPTLALLCFLDLKATKHNPSSKPGRWALHGVYYCITRSWRIWIEFYPHLPSSKEEAL